MLEVGGSIIEQDIAVQEDGRELRDRARELYFDRQHSPVSLRRTFVSCGGNQFVSSPRDSKDQSDHIMDDLDEARGSAPVPMSEERSSGPPSPSPLPSPHLPPPMDEEHGGGPRQHDHSPPQLLTALPKDSSQEEVIDLGSSPVSGAGEDPSAGAPDTESEEISSASGDEESAESDSAPGDSDSAPADSEEGAESAGAESGREESIDSSHGSGEEETQSSPEEDSADVSYTESSSGEGSYTTDEDEDSSEPLLEDSTKVAPPIAITPATTTGAVVHAAPDHAPIPAAPLVPPHQEVYDRADLAEEVDDREEENVRPPHQGALSPPKLGGRFSQESRPSANSTTVPLSRQQSAANSGTSSMIAGTPATMTGTTVLNQSTALPSPAGSTDGPRPLGLLLDEGAPGQLLRYIAFCRVGVGESLPGTGRDHVKINVFGGRSKHSVVLKFYDQLGTTRRAIQRIRNSS